MIRDEPTSGAWTSPDIGLGAANAIELTGPLPRANSRKAPLLHGWCGAPPAAQPGPGPGDPWTQALGVRSGGTSAREAG